MYQYEVQKAADKLINDIFAVKKNESVVITCDTQSDMDIVNATASAVWSAGAHPMVISLPSPRGVGKAGDPDLPIEPLAAALSVADVWIEYNQIWLLYSTPFEIAFEKNKDLRYMCLVEFSKDVFIRTVGDVDIPPLQTFMKQFAVLHIKGKEMHVTTPAGTDVDFEIEPTHYVACDCGDASVPGMHMLTGQINVVPRFGTINGTIVFDGTVTPPFGGSPTAPIFLTIKNSKVTAIKGDKSAKIYEDFLKSFDDEGMFKMAHIAYGFNPGAKLTGNVVEDERVWGCTEWGIGYVSPIDAPPYGQDAKSHTDGICLNSTVWLDGKLLMKEGKIVDPELLKLAPIK